MSLWCDTACQGFPTGVTVSTGSRSWWHLCPRSCCHQWALQSKGPLPGCHLTQGTGGYTLDTAVPQRPP